MNAALRANFLQQQQRLQPPASLASNGARRIAIDTPISLFRQEDHAEEQDQNM